MAIISSVLLTLKFIKMKKEEFINEILSLGESLSRCVDSKEIEDTYKEARYLYKKHLEAINYSRCCKSDSEQLKCDCCNGTGLVEGDDYDDIQGCLTCNGAGTF